MDVPNPYNLGSAKWTSLRKPHSCLSQCMLVNAIYRLAVIFPLYFEDASWPEFCSN
jgi:hypothetical protein